MDIGVPRGTSGVSDLYGTRDGFYSQNTSIDYIIYDSDLDMVDVYMFDPQEILDTDFLEDDLEQSSASKTIKDPMGADMFNLTLITHPSGSNWWPMDPVSSFIQFCIHKSLDRESHNLMRADCLRPFLDNKAGISPNLDPELLTNELFLFKSGKDPRKGIEHYLKHAPGSAPEWKYPGGTASSRDALREEVELCLSGSRSKETETVGFLNPLSNGTRCAAGNKGDQGTVAYGGIQAPDKDESLATRDTDLLE
ncbi:hypothetical protein NDU88_003618 [Pleurodeles waltl]|uniref:Uncharacterized protein n=1 Tax=Pleurodeles waltl TaxID=8319 RepID=A0AAV7M9C0_PLEWA|nr:hypothetical protein NDU88_003618 [Pleurodeles waltl]